MGVPLSPYDGDNPSQVNKTAFETWFVFCTRAAMPPILFTQTEFYHAQISSKVKTTPK